MRGNVSESGVELGGVNICGVNTAAQSQKAVTAYFLSKQLLPFGFAEQNTCQQNRERPHANWWMQPNRGESFQT